FIGHRFRRRWAHGVACNLVEPGARQVVAHFPEIEGGVAVRKAGSAQDTDDAVEVSNTRWRVEAVNGKIQEESGMLEGHRAKSRRGATEPPQPTPLARH